MHKFCFSCRNIVVFYILLLLYPCGRSYAQLNSIRFDRLTIDDGLSQNSINAILEDNLGFIWFGTQDGLNIYDGKGFKIIKPEENRKTWLTDNWIYALHQDKNNLIWIGTHSGGICVYDPVAESFVNYELGECSDDTRSRQVTAIDEDAEGNIWIGTYGGGIYFFDIITKEIKNFCANPQKAESSLNSNLVHDLIVASDGIIWIATFGGGLNRLDPKTGEYEYYLNIPDVKKNEFNDLYTVYEDSKNNIWIGSRLTGLIKFEYDKKKFINYQYDENEPNSISGNTVRSILEDKEGYFWVGTEQNGLNRLDPETGVFRRFKHDPTDPQTIGYDNIWSIYEDRSGGIWIGTNAGGVNRYDKARNSFTLYKHKPGDPNSISHNAVQTVCVDQEGYIWVGTELGGIDRIDRKHGRVKHFKVDPDNPYALNDQSIEVIREDPDGNLWIGTRNSGLNFYNRKTGLFKRYKADPQNENLLSNPWIRCLWQDAGFLWVGTGGGGLNRMNLSTGKIKHFYHEIDNSNTISNNIITTMFRDSRNTLWIGTRGGGVNMYVEKTGRFKSYIHNDEDESSISHNVILCVCEDKKGRIWVSTPEGINKYNSEDESFTRYNRYDGLPNDVVYAMMCDEFGYLWISTNNGIAKFDPDSMNFSYFDEKDGLQSKEFNQEAYFQSRDGELFFGGIHGLDSIYPSIETGNKYIPPVYITEFRKFDRVVALDSSVAVKKSISLNFDENFFSFTFAALNFTLPEKNEYAYKLEGVDKNWIDAGTRNYASYTNVDPGKYVFKVKASNNDGLWNEEGAQVNIRIIPPYYGTWWFRITAVIFLGVLVIAIYKIRVYNLQKTNRILEKRVAERTAELNAAMEELTISRQADIEREKLQTAHQFAITVAHEFNNPLSIVQGVYDLLKIMIVKDENKRIHEHLDKIPRAVQRMKSLVDKLLKLTSLKEKPYFEDIDYFDLYDDTEDKKKTIEDNIDREISMK